MDYLVIGAGIVGIAVARQLALGGRSVLLLERDEDVLCGASGANSSLLHCGFDANPLYLEGKLVVKGGKMMETLLKKTGLLSARGGALVVAWTQEEEEQLPALLARAHANGCHDVELLKTPEQVLQKEPHLAHSCKGALWVPREYVADSWLAGMLLLHQGLHTGRLGLLCNVLVKKIFFDPKEKMYVINGVHKAKQVVNCAGLDADLVEKIFFGSAGFEARPRMGQFAMIDRRGNKEEDKKLSCIVYPVPTKRTKGVVIWENSAAGVVIVGPTAEETSLRRPPPPNAQTAENLRSFAEKRVRFLGENGGKNTKVEAYVGIRPATTQDDYLVEQRGAGWTTVASIRSTGFSSCLALAQHVAKLCGEANSEQIECYDLPPDFCVVFDPKQHGIVSICGRTHRVSHPQARLKIFSRL